MVMRGVDVSNWQAGLDVSALPVDFVLVKATEGVDFVDQWCDTFVQQADTGGKKWGYYHFARGNDAATEARFFVEHTRGYVGRGIPVLDIEHGCVPGDWGEWATIWVDEVERLTGVCPMIYTSASELGRFRGTSLPSRCGLWCAGYPYSASVWPDDTTCPYDVAPWAFAAIWQFTDSLAVYHGAVDGDIAYMDSAAWDRYAGASADNGGRLKSERPMETIADIAAQVIAGEWGNGAERRRRLTDSGHDYRAVQDYVERVYLAAHDVIHGDYGNGAERVEGLRAAGFDPELVQKVVNKLI